MHPNQKRALAYLKRKGTDAPFSASLERLRGAAAAMDELLATVGETAARRRPGDGRWSVQEVADHLAVSHRLAFEQWRAALDGRDPGPAVEAHLMSPDVMQRPFHSVRGDLAALHREWLDLAAKISDDAFSATPAIPILMVIKGEIDGEDRVFEWVEPVDAKAFALAFAVHTREHEAQIRRTLEELASDPSLDLGLDGGPVLESERLRLRPVTAADAEALGELFNRSGVRRYLFDDEPADVDRTRGIIDASLESFRSRGYGLWLASLHGQDQLAGFGGYGFFYEPPELQLYYGLAPELWGRGLATELARRVLDYGFDQLGFDQVVGATDAPNEASVRVMERLGMERLPDQMRNGQPAVYFRAVRAD